MYVVLHKTTVSMPLVRCNRNSTFIVSLGSSPDSVVLREPEQRDMFQPKGLSEVNTGWIHGRGMTFNP